MNDWNIFCLIKDEWNFITDLFLFIRQYFLCNCIIERIDSKKVHLINLRCMQIEDVLKNAIHSWKPRYWYTYALKFTRICISCHSVQYYLAMNIKICNLKKPQAKFFSRYLRSDFVHHLWKLLFLLYQIGLQCKAQSNDEHRLYRQIFETKISISKL